MTPNGVPRTPGSTAAAALEAAKAAAAAGLVTRSLPDGLQILLSKPAEGEEHGTGPDRAEGAAGSRLGTPSMRQKGAAQVLEINGVNHSRPGGWPPASLGMHAGWRWCELEEYCFHCFVIVTGSNHTAVSCSTPRGQWGPPALWRTPLCTHTQFYIIISNF